MSIGLMALIVLIGLIILIASGLELFVAYGLMAFVGITLLMTKSPLQLASTAFLQSNSYLMTAVPAFIFMGTILSQTKAVQQLFDAAQKWIGFLPGGVACAIVVGNAVFGAMCGSSIAAVATFGKVSYPSLERLGYKPGLALGTIAIAGSLSTTIPPSISLIVYGSFAGVSVPRLFAAALLPGIILALLFIVTIIIRVLINPQNAPAAVKSSWKDKILSLKNLIPWILLIAIVLGTTFAGILTPTESAAIGALGSLILAIVYRQISWKGVKEACLSAAKLTSMLIFILITVAALSQAFRYIGVIDVVSNFFLSLEGGKLAFLIILYIFYLLAGMFVDDLSPLLLTVPFVMPVLRDLGLSPVWFGVWYLSVESIAMISPPFGFNLFVLHSVVPKHPVMTIAKGALPFIVPCLAVSVLVALLPQLALWLPNLLYG